MGVYDGSHGLGVRVVLLLLRGIASFGGVGDGEVHFFLETDL